MGTYSSIDFQPALWLTETHADCDVVISSRCRIARNLTGYPFPHRCTDAQLLLSAREILAAMERTANDIGWSGTINWSTTNQRDKELLIDHRLASSHFMLHGTQRFIQLTRQRDLTAMVHEEDHLRIQAIRAGHQVESTYVRAIEAATRLSDWIDFSQSPEFGFHTSAITNSKTGIRLSAMVHLPGIAADKSLDMVLRAVEDLGCAVRGIYGEGSHGTGELFQLSNRYAFNVEPSRIADRITVAVNYLIRMERQARQNHFQNDRRRHIAANVNSALEAIYTEVCSSERLVSLLSILRLGASEGLIQASPPETACWLAMAGTWNSNTSGAAGTSNRAFSSIQRTAAVRNELNQRGIIVGTFPKWTSDYEAVVK